MAATLAARVLERIRIEDRGHVTPCWISNRAAQPNGYTKMYADGRVQLTHRVAYAAFVGAIAEGAQLDHLCRIRACCNPAHLEPVTGRTNVLRGDGISAREAQQTACLRGHAFTEANTYRRRDRTGRLCRTCSRDRARLARSRT